MINIIINDIKNSFKKNKFKYLAFFLVTATIYSFFIAECQSMKVAGIIDENPSISDALIHILRGEYRYGPGFKEPFKIPASWLAIQLFITFSIGKYSTDEMSGIGQQLLIRSSKKRKWFFGKIAYCFSVVLSYYLIIIAVILFGTLLGLTRCDISLTGIVSYNLNEINYESQVLIDSVGIRFVIPKYSFHFQSDKTAFVCHRDKTQGYSKQRR